MVDAVVESRNTPEHESQLRAEEQRLIWTKVEADRGRTCVVHGRRGVGKSDLAEALLRQARAEGGHAVFEGQTPKAGGRSFHPFAEIVQQALVWAEQNRPEVLNDALYEALAPLLSSSIDAGAAVAVLDQKLALFEAVRSLLARVGACAPIVAVVHGLAEGDADTLELASYLSGELFSEHDSPPRGVLLYLVRDDIEVAATQAFLQELQTRPEVTMMALEGLDLEGLKRYVQSPHVLEKLLAASKGLPQEVDALIEALPNNVEELFARKLDGLNPLQQELLRALAVGGQAASPRSLAAVIDRPAKEVAKELSLLREERVVDRKIESGEFQFAFTRWRDLEVTQRNLADAERRRLHGGWARALGLDTEGAHVALVAHHQLNSDDPKAGVPLALEAAETYAVSGAFHAALKMLEQARPHAEGATQVSILNRLAELAPITGNPQRALQHIEDLRDSMPEGERGLAYMLEAELHNLAGEADLSLVALAEARRFSTADDPQTTARLAAAESEAHYLRSEFEDASHAVEQGLKHLKPLGADAPIRLKLELLNQRGKAALAREDADEAVASFEETRRATEQAGLQSEEARALVNLGMAHLQVGDLDAAETRLRQGIECAKSANSLRRLAFGTMNLGVLQHRRGDLGQAVECYRECRSLFRRLGNRHQLARVLYNLGSLHLMLGDLEEAQAHNQEALGLAEQTGVERVAAVATVVEGVILGQLGDFDSAEGRLREGIRRQRRQGHERWVEAMVEFLELKIERQDLVGAHEVLNEVTSELESVSSAILSARRDYLAGMLLLAEGKPDIKILTDARGAFERQGRQLFVRDAEVALARACIALERREKATLHLEAAEALQEMTRAALPAALQLRFTNGRSQETIRRVRAELDGRPMPQPHAVTPRVTRPAARTERKSEWDIKYSAIIGSSPKLLRVFHILDRIEKSDTTVLINGESGTGKELIAEAIHRNSSRSSGPFVKLNCAALVESLLLSELFGHERGSFTGAHQRKIGRFEMAAGGTLFLDEIGDISAKTQVALLRVLQEREFERVGGGKPIKVEARIVFATNRNLAQMVRDGTFREDLYYRLKGLTIDTPPLRQRPGDIGGLAQHFLRQYAAESGDPRKRLTPEALQLLSSNSWPGNIRELENVLRSVALFAENQTIQVADFDEYRELFAAPGAPAVGSDDASVPSAPGIPAAAEAPTVDLEPHEVIEGQLLMKIFSEGIPLAELKKKIQDQAIARALRLTEGNITRAAEMLGMRRPRLSQIINADDELKALAQGVAK